MKLELALIGVSGTEPWISPTWLGSNPIILSPLSGIVLSSPELKSSVMLLNSHLAFLPGQMELLLVIPIENNCSVP